MLISILKALSMRFESTNKTELQENTHGYRALRGRALGVPGRDAGRRGADKSGQLLKQRDPGFKVLLYLLKP